MVSIQTSSIEKKDNLSVYNLNYPIIKSDNEKNIINHINQRIYEDIIAFKSAIEDIAYSKNNSLSCISTDYYITYNNNGIISIPIEFSQLDGLYNISYINSYNYDINLEKEIDILLQKERDSLELLETIPGISKISASSIIAEIGTSMDVFKTEKHISSWAGLCPKNNESAGKKKRSGIKSGNNWLRSMLCECAWSATKKKDSRFKNKYWSMVPRMGRKKALIAIANMMLRLIYHLLKTKSTYKELEIQYFIDKDKRREDRIIKELKSKGYLVEKDSL